MSLKTLLDLICILYLIGAILTLSARVDTLEHEVRTHSTTFYMTNTIRGLTR